MDAAAYERVIRDLREQLDERDETIRQLREQLGQPADSLPTWVPHLTPIERRLLIALSDGRLHSRQSLMDDLYSLEAEHPDDKIVQVYICKLRAKLSPLSIAIETVWAQGFKLTPKSVALLRGEATPQSHSVNSVSGGTAQPLQVAAP